MQNVEKLNGVIWLSEPWEQAKSLQRKSLPMTNREALRMWPRIRKLVNSANLEFTTLVDEKVTRLEAAERLGKLEMLAERLEKEDRADDRRL